jgi:hypothetical protein
MREYKLSSEFFSQMTKRIWTVVVPIALLALAGGLWMGGQEARSSAPLLVMGLFLLIVMAFSILSGIRKQKKLWSSYRIILDEDSIKKIQDGLPDVTITFGEIVKIMEAAGLGLSVHAVDPPRQIGVPATLEDYDGFRLALSDRHSFENVPQARTRWAQFLPWAVGLGTIGGFLVTFLSKNPYISAIAGILLFIGLVISLVQIQRNPEARKQMRWQSCFILFPLLGILLRVVLDILLIMTSPYTF